MTRGSILIVVMLVLCVIAGYAVASRRVDRLTEHGTIVIGAALIGGFGCALVAFAAEADGGTNNYEEVLNGAGQVTAAILIAFVIEQRFIPSDSAPTSLDIVGFAYIATSMGTSILGQYPVDPTWQAALAVTTCMGASSGVAAIALRASELSQAMQRRADSHAPQDRDI